MNFRKEYDKKITTPIPYERTMIVGYGSTLFKDWLVKNKHILPEQLASLVFDGPDSTNRDNIRGDYLIIVKGTFSSSSLTLNGDYVYGIAKNGKYINNTVMVKI